ncbi:MAG: hypothetical protein AUH42_00475 [Gemmatimonadetes bacterium 13_1_40CM_70_11]|nr:MAG: hypothetical protein AUH42_00475 [Gemmatimonadetes bacterium 13_1_40CM_70_11]
MSPRALLLALPLCLAPVLAGQVPGWSLSGTALYMSVLQGDASRYRVRAGSWAGAEARADHGHVTLRVEGLSGQLKGDSSGTVARDMRRTAVSVQLHQASWLLISFEALAFRSQSVTQGVSVWRLYGGGIGLSGGLGIEGLRAELNVTGFPGASAAPADSFRIPVHLDAGVRLAPDRWPVHFRLGYRVELIYFTSGRAERLAGLVLGAGLKTPR